MKSIISLILALLGIMIFGIIGGCSTENETATTRRETEHYSTTEKLSDRAESTMESMKDDVSEMFSEAGSEVKDMLPEKENGVITTKNDR